MDSLPASDPPRSGTVEVVEVTGWLDRISVSFLQRQLERAEERRVTAVVIQLDSPGVLVDDARFVRLARTIVRMRTTVAVWVGPSGAVAHGGAAEIVALADLLGMAPGTSLGRIGRQRLPQEEFGRLFGRWATRLRAGTVDDDEALELGIVAPRSNRGVGSNLEGYPTLGDLVVDIPGVASEVVRVDGQPRREPRAQIRFSQLPFTHQVLHALSSPDLAWVSLVAGLGLIVFEFFAASIGIAGFSGALLLISSFWAFDELPVNWWAVAAVAFSAFAFAVDLQTGVPRLWSALGTAAVLVGTLGSYRGLEVTWITLATVVGGSLLFYLAGVSSMIRSRFSTKTVGREALIGAVGVALTDLDPEGVVSVDGGPWRARTSRATPVGKGATVSVSGVEGMFLRVEPVDESSQSSGGPG